MKRISIILLILFVLSIGFSVALTTPLPISKPILEINNTFKSVEDVNQWIILNHESINNIIENTYMDKKLIFTNNIKIIQQDTYIPLPKNTSTTGKYIILIPNIKNESYIKEFIIIKNKVYYTYERCSDASKQPACVTICDSSQKCTYSCPNDTGLGICGKDTVLDKKEVPYTAFALTSDGDIYPIWNYTENNYNRIIIFANIFIIIILGSIIIYFKRKSKQ